MSLHSTIGVLSRPKPQSPCQMLSNDKLPVVESTFSTWGLGGLEFQAVYHGAI